MNLHRLLNFILNNSLMLITGAVAGLAWANLDPAGYDAARHIEIPLTSWVNLPGQHGITVHFLINDILMAFFFAMAGKEIFEAMLPGGALRNWRTAATPVACALGGMAGPAAIYIAGAAVLGLTKAIGRGWAIPCATDIAFGYLVARLIFGRHHPATPFLLLLAIADDAFGLLVLAIFYPVQPLAPACLLLPAEAVLIGLGFKAIGVRSFWWYLLVPGTISWFGMIYAGIHPALSLLPIIPTLPHGRARHAEVEWEQPGNHNALDKLGKCLKNPVEAVLGFFGLVNAGVAFSAVGAPTVLVLVGLLADKPIGIFLSGLLAVKVLRLHLPTGLSWQALFVLGCAAGIGFTVALFVATVAFPPGEIQSMAKMGALLSFLAVGVTFIAARMLGVKRMREG